jgi:predicted dehydrogenase
VQLAIIGAGQISHRFLKQASSRVRFVATCARRLESARARAVEYGIDAWFDDYLKMFDAVKLDGVVIATPPPLHAAPAIAAFERGISVLCEKPMATTFEDCKAMVAAAERHGVTFLCLPYDAQAPLLAALPYLNQATLGTFVGAEAQVLLPGVSRESAYRKDHAGGGVVLDAMTYSVSMLGPARRVTGVINTLIPHRILGDGLTVDLVPPVSQGAETKTVRSDVDDNASLLIEWPAGQQAVVRALWGTSLVRYDTTIYGRHGTLWLSGDNVIIHSPRRSIEGATAMTWGAYDHCYRIPVVPREQRAEGLIEHFADCIEGRSRPTCGGPQQMHVHEILFKCYEAARSGQRQSLETTFEPWRPIDPAFSDTRSRAL